MWHSPSVNCSQTNEHKKQVDNTLVSVPVWKWNEHLIKFQICTKSD